jgi:hypothetical protein
MFRPYSTIFRNCLTCQIATQYFQCNYHKLFLKLKYFNILHISWCSLKDICWRTSLVTFPCAALFLWRQWFCVLTVCSYRCWCGVSLLLCALLVCIFLRCWLAKCVSLYVLSPVLYQFFLSSFIPSFFVISSPSSLSLFLSFLYSSFLSSSFLPY